MCVTTALVLIYAFAKLSRCGVKGQHSMTWFNAMMAPTDHVMFCLLRS